jgi:two-component system NtrC family sensor kinase
MKKTVLIFCFIAAFTCANAQNAPVGSLKSLILSLETDTSDTEPDVLANTNISNNPDSSIYYARLLVAYGKAHHAKQQVSMGLNIISYVLYGKGSYPAALNLALQSLPLIENSKHVRLLAHTCNLIGNIYKELQNYPKALYYYKHGKQYALASHYLSSLNTALFNMAFVYKETDKLDSALYYSKLADYNSRKFLKNRYLGYILGTLGNEYFKLKNYKTALKYYRDAYAEDRKIGDRRDASINCLSISTFYFTTGKPDSAFYYAREALRGAKTISYNKSVFEAMQLMSDLYEAKHQPDSAFKYLKFAGAARDSLYNAAKAGEVENLTTGEFLRQTEIAAAELKFQNRQQKILLIFVLAGLLAAGVFSFVLVVNNRQKHRANKLLQQQQDELRATQAQLIQSEKMASLGELTAGIAHEIQNPLNFVNNFSEVSKELLGELKEELDKGDIEEAKIISDDVILNLEKISHHGKRADAIVKGMLEHSRASTGQKEPTDINTLADEYLRLAYHGLRAKDNNFNAEIITNFDGNLPKVNVIPQDIGRVLLNLFNNAFYAVNQKQKKVGEEYKPEVAVTTTIENGQVIIKIKDNGTGIPDAIKDKIMQPFFTTKPTGEGTGLGLSLTYDIVVKGHGGSIQVDSKEGEWSEFVISLPLNSELS